MTYRDHTIPKLHIGRASDMLGGPRALPKTGSPQIELPLLDTRLGNSPAKSIVPATRDAVQQGQTADNTASWKERGPAGITMPGHLPNFAHIPIGSLGAVMLHRERQIDRGHTLASDLANYDDKKLPRLAIRLIGFALEDMHFRRSKDWRRLAQSHLAEAGALLLAAWDRLDAR